MTTRNRTSEMIQYNIYFFLEFIIRLYDKNSESDYFFFLHQSQNIFFRNIGNQNIFLEKNHNPPFKLNGRSLIGILIFVRKLIFAALYCMLCSKLRCASDDGSHMEQPCAIHGRITEVLKAFPNSTLLKSPYFPRRF
jgi:hypothetical protein